MAIARSSKNQLAMKPPYRPFPLIMNKVLRLFTMLAIASCTSHAAEPVAKQFLRFMYGADGIQISNICYASDDLWMLPGAKEYKCLGGS
jgi:hypothetical protein